MRDNYRCSLTHFFMGSHLVIDEKNFNNFILTISFIYWRFPVLIFATTY